MGSNYLSSRSIGTKVTIQKKKPRLDKPLVVKPIDDSTESKPGHGEPLLKTVELNSNLGRQLPCEIKAAQNLFDSNDMLADEVLEVEEIITPVLELLPPVVSPQTVIVEEESSINPASPIADEYNQPVPGSIFVNSDSATETLKSENEHLTMDTESETEILGSIAQSQVTEADNEICSPEIENVLLKVVDESETQHLKAKDECQIQVENKVQDENGECETQIMETVEAVNKTESLEESIIVMHEENNGLVIEEITKEFTIEEQIEEIIPENSEENINTVDGEIEIRTKSDILHGVNVTNVRNNENSCEHGFKVVEDEATAPVEVDESLLESINIEKMIREEEDAQWQGHGDNRVETSLLSAWDVVDSDSEKLLAEVNLSNVEESIVELKREKPKKTREYVEDEMNNLVLEEVNEEINAANQPGTVVEVYPMEPNNVEDVSTSRLTEQMDTGNLRDNDKIVKPVSENPQNVETERLEALAVASNSEKLFLEDPISIEKIINDGEETWDKNREEQVQAAILAAALSVVDSSAEKLLTEAALEGVSNY